MKIAAVLLSALLAGCASAPPPALPPGSSLFDDGAFGASSEPVDTSALFALSPEMRAYLHSPGFSIRVREKGAVAGLLDALYDKGELKLEYESSTTRTAAQTFAAKSGNCLSLVIMTAAFAYQLGMKVQFQSVDVDETWSRTSGLYLVSSHVNLSLSTRNKEGLRIGDLDHPVTVDFLPPPEAARFRTRALEEDDIVTLYMNNRAAEALVQNRIDDAYWWARTAVARPNAPVMAFNTLGVVYQKRGDGEHAERVFRAALEREPDNLVVMQNLVPVLAANGKPAESAALAARLAKLDPDPPFRFFDEGMKAFNRGDYAAAKRLFEREVERAPYNDEFHFWLALACLRLGEPARAREQLSIAIDTTTRRETRALYSAKLAHLRSLVPQAPAR
ncbi:tetratricopeptide repeat protein [Massilia agilis]|uniref:Tetratricopeptide repeat protein n=1 Tax=Massilia agilis TaxID=1811226 RepID=A0ABT2DGY6_9BURK|nr:tetratricopeptide repeat protein [Massilia agilis]MCS0809691.1 tetratricopeptide repeat protein [Massilia agilis]